MRHLLVLAALLFALPAHPGTFYVDSEIDDVDALPGDGVCATLIGTCTLRAAIQETNARLGEDAIEVPAGDYVLTIEGTGEDAALTGDLDVTDDLILTGVGLDETVIDAAGLDRVLHIPYLYDQHTYPGVELTGVTVTGGEANGGAGIWADNDTELSIFDSAVEENLGGGIAVDWGSDLLLSASIVEGNTASSVGGINGYWSIVTIEDSTIRGNSGGVFGGVAGQDSSFTIRDSVITENSGSWVGGLSFGDGHLLIERTTISNNSGESLAGGMRVISWLGPQISNSTIAENHSDSGAGGILAADNTWTTIDNTTISGNTGYEGGGIAVNPGSGVSLFSSTIVENSAQRGGGIFGDTGPPSLIANSIMAKNSASLEGPDCYVRWMSDPLPSGGHNILGNASDCELASSTGDQVGTAESPIDPLIGPLADNGGPTKTHALLVGSPAIDAIPVANCTYDDDDNSGTPEVPLTEDQRGVSRPQGEACDIGAYEATSCSDGIDNDRDGRIDWNGGPGGKPADPGCVDASDLSERDPFLPCDDGADNDGDGRTDFDPFTFANLGDETTPPSGSGDPGCFSPSWHAESSQCQDGRDNDSNGKIDYDGGLSVLGYAAAEPDPNCARSPYRLMESPFCGLGTELALLLPPLMWMWRRRRPLH